METGASFTRLACGAGGACAAVLLLVACGEGGKSADAKKQEPKPALTVTTAMPLRAQLPVTLAANGNLVAWQEAIIGAEVSGLRVSEVRVNVGDSVRKGDVLAVFAADTVRADVAQARANVAQAEASAAEAAGNAQRARRLDGTGALSTMESQQMLTGEKTAQARVLAAQAALQAQEVRLAQTSLQSPDDGIVSARSATVGAVVAAGTELFRLIRQGRLEWRAEVTSAELGRVVPGTLARITAASGAKLEGRVRTVGPTVDAQNRTALVYVDVKAQGGQAWGSARAGMFARGEFDLGAVDALTVPLAAVVVREGFSYVFRVGTDNRVAQVKVQAGRVSGDRIEVVSGLAGDTRIVANGAGFLNDGDLVRIAAPANAPAATPAASDPPPATPKK
ncbi:MAG: efflux RND transporter periplasmic adaptor subunit [Usitatibacter sp.]